MATNEVKNFQIVLTIQGRFQKCPKQKSTKSLGEDKCAYQKKAQGQRKTVLAWSQLGQEKLCILEDFCNEMAETIQFRSWYFILYYI